MEENIELEIVKEVAKDVYSDAGRSVVKPTGELIGLLPRTIKAALAPVEKWILQKEYNVAETKKLLEEKLSSVPPELIETPAPHVAVPAFQYISYCMDNEELRDMYANLLANSMNKVVKNGVHPGFVEIIKQLCPDEAKILKYLMTQKIIPILTLRRTNQKGEGMDVFKNFSDVGDLSNCEQPFEINKYFDNLARLGLIDFADGFESLVDKTRYEPLKKHRYLSQYIERIKKCEDEYNIPKSLESYISITDFGEKFCDICLGTTKIVIQNQEL